MNFTWMVEDNNLTTMKSEKPGKHMHALVNTTMNLIIVLT